MTEKHHPRSPSILGSYERCPHYEKDDKDSEAAERGTHMHKAVELEQPEMIADEYDRRDVMKVLFLFQQLRDKHPDYTVHKEVIVESLYNYGSIDFMLLSPDQDHAIIIDEKFGKVPVTPTRNNLQLGNYGFNAYYEYPQLTVVDLGIIQPAIKDEIDWFELSKSDLGRIDQRINTTIDRRKHKNMYPHTPDPIVCEWCTNKGACPAMTALAIEAARETQGIPMPGNWQIGTEKTPEQRSALQTLAPLLEDYCKQIKRENTQYVAHGGVMADHKLTGRSGAFKVEDQSLVREHLRRVGLTEEELWSFSKTNAKKAVESWAQSNTMIDAAVIMQALVKVGACSQGDRIEYLRKTYKEPALQHLKETT